jgi:uncharacterized protein (TIGR01777 family)
MSESVIITGGSGLIGRALTEQLLRLRYDVVILTRNPSRVGVKRNGALRFVLWDGSSPQGWLKYVEGAYGIVNLAGHGIASGRWNSEEKRRILDSRMRAGGAVHDAVKLAIRRPRVVVQASAIGFYGNGGDDLLDESSPRGSEFLSEVAEQWEGTTAPVERLGVRHVVIRTALVLGRGAEFIRRISLPFKLGVGGPQGSGLQWVSWIHVEDEALAICFLLGRSDLGGVFNLSSPEPVRNEEFSKAIGRALHRPCWLQIPAFVLELGLGEMAKELILSSKRVMPKRLLDAGFVFRHPDIDAAVLDVVSSGKE